MSADYLSQLLALQPPGAALPPSPKASGCGFSPPLPMVSSASTRVPTTLSGSPIPDRALSSLLIGSASAGFPGNAWPTIPLRRYRADGPPSSTCLPASAARPRRFSNALPRSRALKSKLWSTGRSSPGFHGAGNPCPDRRRAVLLDGDGSRSTCYILSVRFFILR